jgi:DNA-directed RNA polymerase
MQIANMSGNDKLALSERVQWSIDNADKVEQCARDPLADDWWLQVENPWQLLSACTELDKALSSGDPENFISHLPVYQDGSCNGLQHYAALARDQWGGSSVNLTPPSEDRPMDVYSDVCALVLATVQRDAANGNGVATLCLPHVVRKVVKQTVMTSVYGVTFVGAKNQIQRQLIDRGMHRDSTSEAAQYLARETLAALHNMFTNARAVMDWLAECAQIVALQGQPMTWTSPVGIPIVQPYRRPHRFQVQTALQCVTLCESNDLLPVSNARQKAAFPPNFVHSLDASHMMFTAMSCYEAGLTFSSVHDSFWTHAGTVDDMSHILRQEFINLYRRPILEDFKESLELRFPVKFPAVPPKGDLDIRQVLDAPYFFS